VLSRLSAGSASPKIPRKNPPNTKGICVSPCRDICAVIQARLASYFVPVGTCPPNKNFFAPAASEGGVAPLIPVGDPKLATYLVPTQQKMTTLPGA